MQSSSVASPLGQYKPDALVLAPEENPEDGNVRPLVSQMLEQCREGFFATARRLKGPWRDWGDPAWTQFPANIVAVRVCGDSEWEKQIDHCLRGMCEAAEEAFRDPIRFQELPLPGAANNSFEIMGHTLMKHDAQNADRSFTETGVRLAKYFVENVFANRGGVMMDRRGCLLYHGESIQGLPMWDTGVAGQPAPARSFADGRMALVYVDRSGVPAIKLRFSGDGGRTFSESTELVLHQPSVESQTTNKQTSRTCGRRCTNIRWVSPTRRCSRTATCSSRSTPAPTPTRPTSRGCGRQRTETHHPATFLANLTTSMPSTWPSTNATHMPVGWRFLGQSLPLPS